MLKGVGILNKNENGVGFSSFVRTVSLKLPSLCRIKLDTGMASSIQLNGNQLQ